MSPPTIWARHIGLILSVGGIWLYFKWGFLNTFRACLLPYEESDVVTAFDWTFFVKEVSHFWRKILYQK